jgi:glycosyltransferase involved in cell wall biosynthesis
LKILYLTMAGRRACRAGTARDHVLAQELHRRGHLPALIALMSRPRVASSAFVRPRVFFGQVSLFLEQRLPVLRRLPPGSDLLWDHPATLALLDHHPFGIDRRTYREIIVSILRGPGGPLRREFDKLLAHVRGQRPDVVCISSGLFLSLARPLKQQLQCPVVSLFHGVDALLELWPVKPRYDALEALRHHVHDVDAFLAASRWQASLMRDWFAIPQEKVWLAPPGVVYAQSVPPERAPRADVPVVGFLGRVAPEKGLHLLCDAYILMRRNGALPGGRLEAAGYLDPEHLSYLAEVKTRMAAAQLASEFVYHGELDSAERARFLAGVDVLSIPSTYPRSDARGVLDALAAGVPVVQPRRGAFPEVVEETHGGLVVAPDDPDQLAEGLLSVLSQPDRGAALGRAARAVLERRFTIEQEVDRMLEACAHVSRAWAGPRAA